MIKSRTAYRGFLITDTLLHGAFVERDGVRVASAPSVDEARAAVDVLFGDPEPTGPTGPTEDATRAPRRCDHWTTPSDGSRGVRCDDVAEVHLVAPDGRRTPGGSVCRRHADAVVSEYDEKLGEAWYSEEMDR